MSTTMLSHKLPKKIHSSAAAVSTVFKHTSSSWRGHVASIAVGMLASLCVQLPAMTVAEAAVAPIPAVKPVPENGNLPMSSAKFSGARDYGDLALYGYSETEYYLSGKASVRNQETGAVEMADLPYTTRILIRRPINPKAFSGNVVLEPFHAVLDKNDMWRQTHSLITRNGDVWVGLTVHGYSVDQEPDAQYLVGGVPMLKAYDPERYGPLDLYPDKQPVTGVPVNLPPQSLDLMAQVATLIKTSAGPFSDLRVKKLYTMGAGASGELVTGFIRTGMSDAWTMPDGKPLFDGYMAGAMVHFKVPEPKNAALVVFRSENEMDRAASWGYMNTNPDTPAYRIYNTPGTAHLGSRNRPDDSGSMRQINGVLPKPELKLPYMVDQTSCSNINDEPVDLFLSALLSRLEAWGSNKTPLPLAPRPETIPGDPGAPLGNPTGAGADSSPKVALLKRDPVSGNVVGGVRLPWLEAPVAQYPLRAPRPAGMGPGGPPGAGGPPPGIGGAGGPPRVAAVFTPSDAWPRATKEAPKLPIKAGGGPCFLFNPRIPYDQATLHKLYKNYDDYLQKFETAKAAAIKAGYLLKEDAVNLHPRGNPSDF